MYCISNAKDFVYPPQQFYHFILYHGKFWKSILFLYAGWGVAGYTEPTMLKEIEEEEKDDEEEVEKA